MGICFHCGKKIDDIDKMSIEHKTPWLDSDDPVGLFYDLDNICFSHAVCNTGAARKPTKKGCPSPTSYLRGCRCNGCVESFRARQRKHWHSCGKQAREARKVREAL